MSRFILLRGIAQGNAFFTSYDAETETIEDACKLADGTVAYEYLGLADSVEEAQTRLYGRSFPFKGFVGELT